MCFFCFVHVQNANGIFNSGKSREMCMREEIEKRMKRKERKPTKKEKKKKKTVETEIEKRIERRDNKIVRKTIIIVAIRCNCLANIYY